MRGSTFKALRQSSRGVVLRLLGSRRRGGSLSLLQLGSLLASNGLRQQSLLTHIFKQRLTIMVIVTTRLNTLSQAVTSSLGISIIDLYVMLLERPSLRTPQQSDSTTTPTTRAGSSQTHHQEPHKNESMENSICPKPGLMKTGKSSSYLSLRMTLIRISPEQWLQCWWLQMLQNWDSSVPLKLGPSISSLEISPSTNGINQRLMLRTMLHISPV